MKVANESKTLLTVDVKVSDFEEIKTIFLKQQEEIKVLKQKVDQYEKALKRIAHCEFDGWSGSDVLGKVTDFANEILKS
jgi:hypothetical protein